MMVKMADPKSKAKENLKKVKTNKVKGRDTHTGTKKI